VISIIWSEQLLPGVGKPAPDLHRVPGRRVGPADAVGLVGRQLYGGRESSRRVPDAKPAITEPASAPDRSVRAPADNQRNFPGWRGGDDRIVKVEERAVITDWLTSQQLAHDGEAFIHPLRSSRDRRSRRGRRQHPRPVPGTPGSLSTVLEHRGGEHADPGDRVPSCLRRISGADDGALISPSSCRLLRFAGSLTKQGGARGEESARVRESGIPSRCRPGSG
jgi:hypothetical protein